MVQVLRQNLLSAEAQEALRATAVCRFTAFAPLSDDEVADLMALASGQRELVRGEYLVHEGDAPAGIHLLVVGWTVSSVAFADGRRHLIKAHLPGDLLGLPSIALARAADSVIAVTPAVVASIAPAAIGHLFETRPRLAALLFLVSQEERVTLMDRLASIGATDAASRLAALLLQVHARGIRALPSTGDSFDFPLLQNDVADMIGVTAVHLNRTAQQLRRQGIITWQRQRVVLHDVPVLERLAGLPRRDLARDQRWLPPATQRT